MELVIKNLNKIFRADSGDVRAADNVSLSIPQGKFYTLLGPSGSGKTTILRCIGGLELPDSGEISLGDKIFYSDEKRIGLMPEERGIGMVFQSYAIWPHMTVMKNVAFPLHYGPKRIPKDQIKSRVEKVLSLVHMEGLESRMATQLSGGQQQRVALARALVSEPDLLLLDEPLSNLDAKLRDEMRVEIRRIQTTIGITTIYVTHDQAEALSMSDQIALLRGGRVVQVGPPRELYEKPRDFFTSSFIGTSNCVPGVVRKFTVVGDSGTVLIQGRELSCIMGEGCRENGKVVVSIRPEDIDAKIIVGAGPDGWQGVVRHVVYFGESMHCEIEFGGDTLLARLHPSNQLQAGDPVNLSFQPDRCVAFPPDKP
ncbi:MAG: ABC transporter ATP-binding protein [Desulfobacterales bacterium]|nr:ABC transporter ATP-binding protein [Desulfobacterales bacterium]